MSPDARKCFHPSYFDYEKEVYERNAYTPQFSLTVSAAVRRLAWFLKKPMTQTIKLLVLALPAIIDSTKICNTCKDKSICKSCIFSHNHTAEEKAALLAAL